MNALRTALGMAALLAHPVSNGQDVPPDLKWLEGVRQMARIQQPEWTEVELDSAYAAWFQWLEGGAPREAGALTWLSPDEQFALERYQAQFGWPRDSTEWRALGLDAAPREALQYLFHRRRNSEVRRSIPLVDPWLAAGWSCSGCSGSRWATQPLRTGLHGSTSAATAVIGPTLRFTLRSPASYPLQVWALPSSVALGLHLQAGSGIGRRTQRTAPGQAFPPAVRWGQRLLRATDRVVVALDSSGTILGDASGRLPRAQWSFGASSRGWFEAQFRWYGPGGLLVSVQREGNLSSNSGARPPAGATPWRPQRGNRATAALPLWGGRLNLQQSAAGRSAAWTNVQRTFLWYPGQLVALQRWNPRCAAAGNLRAGLYVGHAQGASLQGRWIFQRHVLDAGVAGITGQRDVLPRSTGPMALWRPGWTAEASWTYRKDPYQTSVRVRRSPSGWSLGGRIQIPLGPKEISP